MRSMYCSSAESSSARAAIVASTCRMAHWSSAARAAASAASVDAASDSSRLNSATARAVSPCARSSATLAAKTFGARSLSAVSASRRRAPPRSASFTCSGLSLARAASVSPHSGETSRATATTRSRSASVSSRRMASPTTIVSIARPSAIGRSGPNPPARGQSGGTGMPRPRAWRVSASRRASRSALGGCAPPDTACACCSAAFFPSVLED